ncbi:DUF6088 family protein [Pseudomonas sp. NPDC089554]|uniref:DUF6088 family protein n=1 Tax=Pseudomonas sp. NPDC089554 TaxID=3390653 RepID=UPI003D03943B
MKSLPELIIERSLALPEGDVLAPKEFLGMGSRFAVDQAFSRLTKAGKLQRICRGLYIRPISNSGSERSPAPETVVQALARKSNETIVPNGAHAANVLGLTQHTPLQQVFLTNGQSRTLKIGQAKIQLQHAPHWMLATSTTGDAARAFAWLGKQQATTTARNLRQRLPEQQWQQLLASCIALPSWIAAALGNEALND